MQEINLIVAFVGGLISFLAPCVLPIVPGFLAYLAGRSTEAGANRKEVFLNALFFVLGFSFIFAALGVLLNTLLKGVAYDIQNWLARVGGLLVIFFGLYLTGLINFSSLNRERRFSVRYQGGSRYVTSFLFGLAFAAGWTPCVSAALGAILGLAASQPGTAFSLLLAYALGLGVPFLIVGLFVSQAGQLILRYGYLVKYFNMVFGVILIALGVLMFTQTLNLIANFELLNRWLLRQ
ncbi:MAG: sulfite exporter TauE/SafE family protein [Parcubacteria group bacterium]|nr:sulfite exporter TauE/SafE family protein [Parcubacteria group bacterium]